MATALRDWLPMMIQYIEPWLSSEDIPLGSDWFSELRAVLKEAKYGIICLTPENLNSAWLHYEAGRLSDNSESKVVLLLLDVQPGSIKGPLSMVQAISVTRRSDMKNFIEQLSLNTEYPVASKVLDNLFEHLYPRFEASISEIRLDGISNPSSKTQHDRIGKIADQVNQILDIVKAGSRVSEIGGMRDGKSANVTTMPKVFIGSSTEGLEIAHALQENLEPYAKTTVWNQTPFDTGKTVFETMVDSVHNYDFAIIVFSADDEVSSRGSKKLVPRDNVIFELGLFIGTLGRGRTFLVYDKDTEISIPSDVTGLVAATFTKRTDGNLRAALMPVCQRIKRAMGVGEK